ncbi:MAG TPA: helix-turn-helix domain-containing protein [Sphingomicrobium sp.]|jgi:DNA-binding transcriptional regulator YdaS (Cro superfamily)
MTLLDHLNATEEGVHAFADRLGVARSTIRKIAYRQRQPSLELAVRISTATKGAVKPADMIVSSQDVAA